MLPETQANVRLQAIYSTKLLSLFLETFVYSLLLIAHVLSILVVIVTHQAVATECQGFALYFSL